MEKVTGFYRLVQIPSAYQFFQNALGAGRARQRLVAEFIRPTLGTRVLDLGCGPADILVHLGSGVEYVGIDHNQAHIQTASLRFGKAGTFLCGDFSLAQSLRRDGFDLVMCLGLLHHLDDCQVRALIRMVSDLLRPAGRLICVDPTFIEGQHWIARRLAAADSGQHVRRPDAYRELARVGFPITEVIIRNDMLRIPYTHCILNARKSASD
jgi:SAM-dependent methyltransferase